MATIEQSFIEAVLADIVYVDGLTPTLPRTQYEALLSRRITAPLAAEFAARFQVLAVHPGPNTDYQGVVFKDLTDGTLYVSHRGTSSLFGDMLNANVDIAVISGVARDQAAAMVNWWNDISKPANTSYTRAASVSPKSKCFVHEALQ